MIFLQFFFSEDLLKSARFAFVKQDWSKAVNDLSELLNEVRDTDVELDLAMAPVHILYAFCILRQIANRDGNNFYMRFKNES